MRGGGRRLRSLPFNHAAFGRWTVHGDETALWRDFKRASERASARKAGAKLKRRKRKRDREDRPLKSIFKAAPVPVKI